MDETGDSQIHSFSIVDIGAHPGSSCNALRSVFPDIFITCLTTVPLGEDPMYKLNSRKNLQLLQVPFSHYQSMHTKFFVHADVYLSKLFCVQNALDDFIELAK